VTTDFVGAMDRVFGPWPILVFVLSVAALAAFGTFLALRYAQWRQMFDQPGQRRSHSQVTPRGGGIAMVVVVVATAWCLRPDGASSALIAFILGLVAVAGVGWIDDHRPLSARVRLVVHLLASAAVAWSLSREDWLGVPWPEGVLGLVLIGVATLWLATCVNFWNFMDGSNGLVAIQSAFVGAVIVLWLAIAANLHDFAPPWAWLAMALSGACLGFLPFNFPRARIFMGDVGSGGLGFVCGVLLLAVVAKNPTWFWPMLLPPSALLIDAALTLASRILAGKNWTKPHREHLYQWLVRSGRSHARVALLYLAWGILVTVPCLVASANFPRWAPWIAVAELASGALVWIVARRALLRRNIRRG